MGLWSGEARWHPGARAEGRQRVGALRGQGAEQAGESETGAMSNVVISHQSIPFSNKSTENQYKLNNQVQYRRNLTKHNDKTAQMYLCTKNTWEKWRFPWAKLAVCWWWPRVHLWRKTKCKGCRKEKSTCGVPCLVLPLSLFCSLPGLRSTGSVGGRERDRCKLAGVTQVLPTLGSPWWAGFLTQVALATLGWMVQGGKCWREQSEGRAVSSLPDLPNWNSQF